MTDIFIQKKDKTAAYAVEASVGETHLTSDDANLGTISERAMYGLAKVGSKRVLVGALPFSITGCGPKKGPAERGTCSGQGTIFAGSGSLFSSQGMAALKIGDKGQCVGVGLKGSSTVPVMCEVCLGKSLQKESATTQTIPSATDETKKKTFHIRLQYEDGTPVCGAKFIAESDDGKSHGSSLDDDGEATFELEANKCTVRYPQYDRSLDPVSDYGWRSIEFKLENENNEGEHDVCTAEVPAIQNPPSPTIASEPAGAAFLFDTGRSVTEAAGAASLGTKIALKGRVAFQIGDTRLYAYMPTRGANNLPNSTAFVIRSRTNRNQIYRLDRHGIEEGVLRKATIDGRGLSHDQAKTLKKKKLWHHNQKGLAKVVQVTNHELGRGARSTGRIVTLFKYGGKIVWVAGAASSLVDIYIAEDRAREVVVKVSGWTAARYAGAVGCRIGMSPGAATGAWVAGAGAIPGGIIGCGMGGLVLGGISWWAGTNVSRLVYDTVFTPLEKEEFDVVETDD